eukprot:378485_1
MKATIIFTLISSSMFRVLISQQSGSDFPSYVFEEFRNEIWNLVACGVNSPPEEPDPTCRGLTTFQTEVAEPHDFVEMGGSKGALASSLLRLSFHDCGGINPDKVQTHNNDFFTDPQQNGQAGGCNGCLGIHNFVNGGLLNVALEIFKPIGFVCAGYQQYIGRADCWALAATIAVEFASEQLQWHRSSNITIEPAIKRGDIPYYYGRSDCDNGYATGQVPFPFANPPQVAFTFPDPLKGWKHTSEFFKSRFSWCGKSFTDRDIIALICGAHSMGRAHAKMAGFSGSWDFTTQTLDGEFCSILFNEDFILSRSATNVQNLNQSFKTNIAGAKPQWNMLQDVDELAKYPELQQMNPPVTSFLNNLNTDISMVYDISYYIENGLEQNIDCQTNAHDLCEVDEIVLTAPRGTTSLFNKNKSGKQLQEIYECPDGETCCKYIQCPIQCDGGMKRYNQLISIQENTDLIYLRCPAMLARRYSNKLSNDWSESNFKLGSDFVTAFTKMITIGYADCNG